MPGLALSISQNDVEALDEISKETETPDEESVPSSLDMATEMDVTADSSWGEHSPRLQDCVVLNQQRVSLRLR